MKIEGTISLGSLEESISQASSGNARVLRLPIKPRVNDPGVEVSLIQAIATWARHQSEGLLELYLSEDASKRNLQFEKFVRKQPCGLISAGMAAAIVSVADGQSVDAKSLIEEHFESFRNPPTRETQLDLFETERAEWSESTIPAMGPKLFLPCLDHYANGRIPHLYVDYATLRTRIEFNSLVQTLLLRLSNSTLSSANRFPPFSPELMTGVSRIVYELFDNTHKWAVDDADGRPLSSSARGIFLKLHSSSDDVDNFPSEVGTPLQTYLDHWRAKGGATRLIEISIFDSGPGLAARKLRRPLTPDDDSLREFGAICDCFRKHSTTSNQAGRGLGLHYMMKTLADLSGFVRLRSGRLCLYRNLIERPVDFREGWFNRALGDWYGNREEPSLLHNVEGAVFTILLPLV